MATAYTLNNCEAFTSAGVASRRVATIGFFDGVHTGHRFLLSQVQRLARERGMGGMAVTFERHPRQVLQADYCPVLLNTPEEKYRHLAESGIDACVMLDFTPQMAQLSARDFMQCYLRERFGVEVLVMGYDHRFGHERHLTLDDYQAIGREVGIDVLQAEAFVAADLTVSSSAIRRLLQGGDVDRANVCLGYPYELTGTVVDGHHVGRDLGYPTANLRPENALKLMPGRGVYAVEALYGGKVYPAMLNIGFRPTLDNGAESTIEAHLFGFSGNLYGETLTLRFLHRVRDEQRFPSLDALKRQLAEDAATVCQMLERGDNEI